MRTISVVMVTLALLASGCGSDSEATADSAERGEGTASSGGAVCDRMVELSEQGSSVSIEDDPEAAREAAAEMRELAASAPAGVSSALETFAGLLDSFAELDTGDAADMDSFGDAMGMIFDPEVIAAGETLSDYLVEECGIDPLDAATQFGTGDSLGGTPLDGPDVSIPEGDDQFPDSGSTGGDSDDPSDISLDDMDEVKDAHADEAWVDKVFSTGISNNRDISLAAAASEDEFGDGPLTPAEAVEACEAVRIAFEDRQPELAIEVLNGETVVASGSAGVACTAV